MTHIPTLLSLLQIKVESVNTVRLAEADWQLGDPLPQIGGTRPFILIMDAAKHPRAMLMRPTEADASAYTCIWCCAAWFSGNELREAPGSITREKLEVALEHYGWMLRDVAAGMDAHASTEELIPLLRPRWRSEYPVSRDPILRYAALGITLWAHRRNPSRLLALEEALMPLLPGQDTPPPRSGWKALFALRLTDAERTHIVWMGNGTVQAPNSGKVRRRLRCIAHLVSLQRMVRSWASAAVPGTVPGIVDAPLPPLLLSGAEAARQLAAFYAPTHPYILFLRSRRAASRRPVATAGSAQQQPWQMVDGDIEDMARAFPPCIRAMLAKKQDHLRHDTRFSMACYLSACGVDAPEDFLRLAEPGKRPEDVPSFMNAISAAKKKQETFPRGQSCKLLASKELCPYAGDHGKCGAANGLKHTFYNPLFYTIQFLRKRHK